MSVGMQVLAEHIRAFELNNCILRTFPVGYWASVRAAVRYSPSHKEDLRCTSNAGAR